MMAFRCFKMKFVYEAMRISLLKMNTCLFLNSVLVYERREKKAINNIFADVYI